MTISPPNRSHEEFALKHTDDNVVATLQLDYCDKIYTVKVYYESEWEPSDESDGLATTIQRVKSALGVFASQLEDDSTMTLTKENKLLIGKMAGDDSDSYDFSFKGCLPADHIEVYVGEVVEKSDDTLASSSDYDDLLDPQYSERDTLLNESYLEEAKREAAASGKSETLKPHVPINNSSIEESAQSFLQEESRSYSHIIAPRDDGDCGISAFFCGLVAAFVQGVVDTEQVKGVSKSLVLWAKTSGISKSPTLLAALENGLNRIQLLSENPSQAQLRDLLRNPYDYASVNYTLRQMALSAIYQNPKIVENLLEDECTDESTVKLLQHKLFANSKISGKNIDTEVIATLQQVFTIQFALFTNDTQVDEVRVIKKDYPISPECREVKGIAIYGEKGHYYTLLNQRVFQFV